MKIAPFIKAIESLELRTSELRTLNLLNTSSSTPASITTIACQEHSLKSWAFRMQISTLGVGSGTHAEQVGNTMIAFEKVLQKEKPDWVVVVGDVNATLAGSVTAKKEHIKCAHIEAGLRSGDMKMPEEINRLVTDRLSDLLVYTRSYFRRKSEERRSR